MNLTDHARRELDLCGQYAEDPAYSQSIIAAVSGTLMWQNLRDPRVFSTDRGVTMYRLAGA